MGSGVMRIVGSVAGLAVLLVAGAALLAAPTPQVAPAGPAHASGRRSAFHGARSAIVAAEAGTCRGCHGVSPHSRRPRTRAFLNLHSARMDCGTCHLGHAAATYRRVPERGGLVTAGRMSAGGWEPRTMPTDGEALRGQGPTCGECHRPGSSVLASGLYDAYQRRLLEELSLLYRFRGAGL